MARCPAPPRPSATAPILALLLVLLTAATALGLPASSARPAPVRAAALQASPSAAPALVEGDDACALLADADVLLVTGGVSVVSRTPGSQAFLPAGCLVSVEPQGDAFDTTWDIALGVQATGGSDRFDQDAQFMEAQPVAGIGDRASHVVFLDTWNAVIGDTYLTLQVIAFGGDKPRAVSDMGRLLLWRAVTRLEAAGGAAVPGASPGASPSASPAPIAVEQALVERLRAPEYGPEVEDAAIEILARSGIPTYDTPDASDPIVPITGPESPMALLRDQVRAMALEAWAGSGYAGPDLDALIPAQADLAGGAEVVAGYIGAVDTEGARVARLLVGAEGLADPARLVVPQLVLVLLVSDVARDTQAASLAAGLVPVPQPVRAVALGIKAAAAGDPETALLAGPCSAVLGFIDSVLTKVFDTLRLGPSDSAAGQVVVSIWNFVVSLAEGAARKIVKQITQPVLDLIAEVAATVGLASMIVSAIRPWTLAVTADPAVAVKGVNGSPGQEGRWVAHVDLGGFDEWPEAIQDCATAAGRPLPNLKPEGAPVTWSVIGQAPGGLVIEGNGEEKLDKDGTARFPWTTGVDALPEPYEERQGWIGVTAHVDRPAIKELRQLAIDELLSHIPTLVRDTVVPYVRPILERVTAQLDTLLSAQTSGQGAVIYHVPAETPEPGATPPPSRAVMVIIDRPGGSMGLAGRTLELVSCSGPYGAWSGVLRLGGLQADALEVPFADFPMAFAFPGAGGVRRTTTAIEGTVDTNVPNLSYDIAADLTITTDGRTLSIVGDATGETAVLAITAELGGGQLRDLPIVPAPAGTCP